MKIILLLLSFLSLFNVFASKDLEFVPVKILLITEQMNAELQSDSIIFDDINNPLLKSLNDKYQKNSLAVKEITYYFEFGEEVKFKIINDAVFDVVVSYRFRHIKVYNLNLSQFNLQDVRMKVLYQVNLFGNMKKAFYTRYFYVVVRDLDPMYLKLDMLFQKRKFIESGVLSL